MNKLLFTVLLILVVVVIGELSYYFIGIPNNRMIITKSSVISPTSTPTITPSLQLCSPRYSDTNGPVTQMTLIDITEGKIIELDTKEGVIPNSNFKYQLKVSVEKNNSTRTRLYTKEEIKRFDIPVGDFHLGDYISIKSTNDLFKDEYNNLSGLEITIKK